MYHEKHKTYLFYINKLQKISPKKPATVNEKLYILIIEANYNMK